MSDILIPLVIDTQTTIKTKTTIKLNGRQIIELVNERITDNIPANADITFSVPGGGDWSNKDIDFKEESLVTISYTVTTTT